MKKSTSLALIIIFSVILLVSLIGTALYFGLVKQSIVSATFTPVYCNDYSFIGCALVLKSNTNVVLNNMADSYKCPDNAVYCTINNPYSSSSVVKLYAGKTNCNSAWRLSCLGSCFKCDDQTTLSSGDNKIDPSYYIYGFGTGRTFNSKIYIQQLRFYGRAGGMGSPENAGGEVINADGCSYNPSALYSGSKLISVDPSQQSTVVSQGQTVRTYVAGDRHICANIEEQCKSDSDCTGHTYGTKECIGLKLDTYGCTKLSVPSFLEQYSTGYAYKPFQGDNSGDISGLSRCEIISSTPVQCCGDTDCGSNAFCDKTSFTCKKTTECSKDSDCGVSTRCDSGSKLFRTPVCSSGSCTFKDKSIECCSTLDCPNDYYCSSEYKCLQTTNPKIDCPLECCVGMTNYFDKPCASGQFCINNVCKSSGCTSASDCKTGQVCKDGNCIDEEKLVCEWYQNPTTTKTCSFLFWGCEEKPGCELSTALVIGIIVGGIMLFFGILIGGVILIIYLSRNVGKRRK